MDPAARHRSAILLRVGGTGASPVRHAYRPQVLLASKSMHSTQGAESLCTLLRS